MLHDTASTLGGLQSHAVVPRGRQHELEREETSWDEFKVIIIWRDIDMVMVKFRCRRCLAERSEVGDFLFELRARGMQWSEQLAKLSCMTVRARLNL